AAGASINFVFARAMSRSDWLLLLFPYLYGSVTTSIYSAQPIGIAASIKLWEHSAYVGILPLGLAAYAILDLSRLATPKTRDSRDDRWLSLGYFALLLIVGLVMAAGRFAHVIYATPVIGKLRDVERAMVLADFALAALAAFGLQRLTDKIS